MWFGINRLRDVFFDRLQCRCCQAAHVGSTPGRRRTGVNPTSYQRLRRWYDVLSELTLRYVLVRLNPT